MSKRNFVWLASVVLTVSVFFTCEDGSDGIEAALTGEVGKTVQLSMSPERVALAKGGEQQFTAFVNGVETTAVEWEISGGIGGGTEIKSGLLKVAGDEVSETLTVTASVPASSGNAVSAKAVVTVLGNGRIPEEHGLTVSPGVKAVARGKSETFTVTLSANGKAPPGGTVVAWTVVGRPDISVTNGTLNVGAGETAAKLIVMAALTDGRYGTAIVYVGDTEAEDAPGDVPVVDGISIDPQTASIGRGEERQFKAYRGGSEVTTGLTWSVSDGTKKKTIEGGLLTVADYETADLLTVRAEASDGSNGTAVVTVTGGAPTRVYVPYEKLKEYLENLTTDTSADSPYTVALDYVEIDNKDEDPNSVWAAVNKAAAEAKKYVVLDLSACTFADNTVSGVYPGYGPETNIPGNNHMNIIKDNEYIKGIILPDGVKEIGAWAFNGCKALGSVTIPGSVTTIGEGAFYSCFALESVIITEGVTTIGAQAFYNCTALTSVDIPDSVTTIGAYAFFNCTALTSVDIPGSVKEIGELAFAVCSALESVTIPESVTTIGELAFAVCSALESVTIPESVETIGMEAFNGCEALTSVTFNGTGTDIETNAFPGDLKTKYGAASGGGAGTYTRNSDAEDWTKQPQ